MRRNWFWGIFLVLAAGILVVSQLGLFSLHIGFWTIVIAMFLVAGFVASLIRLAVPGMVFSLAFLAIIFARPLGIAALAPWTILGAALLLTIGLSLIIKPRWYHAYVNRQEWHHHWAENHDDVESISDQDAVVDVNMSSSIRYIQSPDFRQAVIKVSMGNAKVYFDEVQLNPAGASIVLETSFSGAELYIPRTWNVKTNVDVNFGTVEEKGIQEAQTEAPAVSITGKVSFGGVTIIYI
ncbi:LiaF transmembrane domain-containing protein [Levilactobacillus brevis]|uniref:LiaF transmembrane domain-containing protein n=1 Tax=Levilactobacillus brevis TaxID=1580 RepID=UPI0020734450|nr:hypothetical protein [Levilactobacillus brevis]MCM6797040.1 hypothetical protein [Levilactobacillus brevis]